MKTLFLILIPSVALAGGPKYTYKTPPGLDDEINNIYHDIRAPRPFDYYAPYTLAQLKTVTPTLSGQAYYCSDCATTPVCISTGTTIFGFSSFANKATACN